MQGRGEVQHVNMLPPGAYIIEIGLNTWLDASCWLYKGTQAAIHTDCFFPSLLKRIYPCYPYPNDFVVQSPYMCKVQNFITSNVSKNKPKE